MEQIVARKKQGLGQIFAQKCGVRAFRMKFGGGENNILHIKESKYGRARDPSAVSSNRRF